MNRKRKRKVKSRKKYRLLKWGGYLLLSAIVSCLAFVWAVSLGVFGALPDNLALQNIKNPQGSVIFDRHGKEIGKFYLIDRRSIGFEEMPKCLTDLLVATEDARFFNHDGVDYRSLVRVFFKTILLQDKSGGGGSTLTQQLAKNLFPRKRYGWLTIPVNKVKEVLIARKVEEAYSKEEILAMYLNTVPFGDNVYGVDAAASHFFNKRAARLQCHEAALLVGILKANTYYSPRRYPDRALDRRNTVLTLGYEQGYVDASTYEGAKAKPLDLNMGQGTVKSSFAGYFKDQVLKQARELLDGVNAGDTETPNIFTDGLKIYTTLDAKMQAYAEGAVAKWMPTLQKEFDGQWKDDPLLEGDNELVQAILKNSSYYQQLLDEGLSGEALREALNKPVKMDGFSWSGKSNKLIAPLDHIRRQAMLLNTGMVAMAPQSGEVLAWVGGIGHQYFKYDHVNSRPGRQTGSVFKPIVYATALEKGVSPCKYYKAKQETYVVNDEEWTPGNAGEHYDGKYSMKGALTGSVNTVAVKVLEETGIANVLMVAEGMGIDSPLPKVPSLALGTASVPLLEVVNAYCAFANRGKVSNPVIITKIEDNSGGLIWEKQQEVPTEAISEETALLITNMLQNVVNEGTGAALRSKFGLSMELAGKTGTTQNNADGWFLGYNPNIVVGVWVGNDLPALHFKTTALGQGAHTALPIFGNFMKALSNDRAFRNYTQARFDEIPESLKKHLDCDPFKEEMRLIQWLFGKKDKNKRAKRRNGERKNFFKKLFNSKD